MKSFIEYVKNNNLGNIYENVSFKKLTSLKMGGEAAVLFEPFNLDALIKGYLYLKKYNIFYFVIGNGTNLLVDDILFNICLIRLNHLNQITYLGDGCYMIEAGVKSMAVGRKIAKEGFLGSAFMAMIPASVGGLIYMNGGSYRRFVSDCLYACEYIDEVGKIRFMTSDFGFGYRDSIFQHQKSIITKGYFKFTKAEDEEEPMRLINRYFQMKKLTQPLNEKNAGSVFRNPDHIRAWEIIDQLGYRGYRIGDCEVSLIHTNFIVNKNDATFKDMEQLICEIKEKAKEKFKIELICEWKIIKIRDITHTI